MSNSDQKLSNYSFPTIIFVVVQGCMSNIEINNEAIDPNKVRINEIFKSDIPIFT